MDTIDFTSLFVELDLDPTLRHGNFVCPFCGKKSFKPYRDNGVARCHACGWGGNAINLWSEIKKVDTKQAFADLVELYNLKSIKLKPKTRQEAVDQLARDLEFLAQVRMYFAFYQSERLGMQHYQKRSDFSRAQFSKVINGRFDLVSKKSWNSILLTLRASINVKAFQKDVRLKSSFWREKLAQDEALREGVSKFM